MRKILRITWKVIRFTLLFLIENCFYIAAFILLIKGNYFFTAIFFVLMGIGSDVQIIKKELKKEKLSQITDEERWLSGRTIK